MSHDPEGSTEMTPCSSCEEEVLDETLTSVTADPQSEYRVCPACVRKMDREARAERTHSRRQ